MTNDVSGDQGAYSEETEEYRNLSGQRSICALAGEADEVYEVLCGNSGKDEETAEKNTAQREDKENEWSI